MSVLTDAMRDGTNMTRTENGARTLKSSQDSLVDFFALGGAMRSRSKGDVLNLYRKAWSADHDLAMKMAFYLRDIRGGLGERKVFRFIMTDLATNYPDSVVKNFSFIAQMGRYDDFFEFVNTPVEKAAFAYLASQLAQDVKDRHDNKPISLLAKWLPSENTSSRLTRANARKFRTFLELDARTYRKMLSDLRGYLNIVERMVSSGKWESIKFDSIPSYASKLYRKAFLKHIPEQYKAYLSAVEKGEKKINASTLYPYDILNPYLTSCASRDRTLDALWKALPNYIPEGAGNSLVVADVSGSMQSGKPMPLASSVGLAMYFAERNDGYFKNCFITFSNKPSIQQIKGDNLYDRTQNLCRASWDMNTDLMAVFNLILRTAVSNKLPDKEMPSRIFIITDMEFDGCVANGKDMTAYEAIRSKYEAAGYKLPSIVFWNVSARNNQSPVKFDQFGTMLVSGQSPSIFKNVMESKAVTPYDLMLDVLMSDRYKDIVA